MDEMVLKHSVHAKCSPSIPAVEHLVGKVNNLETTTSMSNKLRYTISAHSIQLRRERERVVLTASPEPDSRLLMNNSLF